MKQFLIKSWTKLAARHSCRKLNEFLFDCSLHGLGILNYENDRISGEDCFIKQLVPRYLENDEPTILDVGANVGNYTHLVREALPNAKVVAFEPNPNNFKKLKKRFQGHNVDTEMTGLGASEGVLKFYDRKDRDGASSHGSLYRDVIEVLHHVDSVEMEVNIDTLDAYAERASIDRINLLKIDTEGHELEVLKGASRLLGDGAIDLIHLEFNEMNVISRVFFRDFADILADYQAYRLLPSGVIPLPAYPIKTELFAFQNLVFVHRRFAPNKRMKPAA